MERVTTGDASVEKAASGYDEALEAATDNQVIKK
jgi:multiple sugar transport system substrate-binding protein